MQIFVFWKKTALYSCLWPSAAACFSRATVPRLDSTYHLKESWPSCWLIVHIHHLKKTCHHSLCPDCGWWEQGGAGWVNRMGAVGGMGAGGNAGVVELYCLSDSGTARGNGWSQPRDNAWEHAASELKPPLCVRVGNPSQIAVTSMSHTLNMTWESLRLK